MRVTNGRVGSKFQPLILRVYEEVKDKFGFIDMDILTDMFRLLENRESVLKQPIIFRRTLREYREGKINEIYDAYFARSMYARFLRMMAESPHYPKDENQNEAFFKMMWSLLSELWKKNIPQMADTLARKGGGKAGQRARNQTTVDNLSKLIDYGQKVLELLKDPLFQEMFTPPPIPQKGENDKDSKENKSGNKSDGDGKTNDDKDANGQSSVNSDSKDGPSEDRSPLEKGGDGQGSQVSSLDAVQNEFQKWIPYMVEGVLFSQDLKTVSALNAKGKWAATPFPDNSVDVHKIQDSHDLMKLLPGEHALPSDLFYLKFAKKELMCREFMAKHDRRQILYILLDVSGSMHGEKVMMAASVALALLRKVSINKDIYFLRGFDEGVTPLQIADDLKGAQKTAAFVVRNAFRGSDTRIQNALMTAIQDIRNAVNDKNFHAQLKDAQILLLTDGQDYRLNPDVVNAEKGPIKIHSVAIHATGDNLKLFSDTYHEIKSSDNLAERSIELVTVFDKQR